MKRSTKSVLLTALLAGAALAVDSEPTLEPLGMSSFRFDWTGEVGWTYFIQWTLDLQDWNYFPVIDQGEEHDPFEFNSSSPGFFVRLVGSDIETDDPDAADFDGDGLCNLFEVMYGFDPLAPDSDGDGVIDGAEDGDADGSLNLFEQMAGRNPKVKDHPAVKLSVVLEN